VSTAVLYEAWLRRNFIEVRRYYFDSLSGLLTIYAFFVVLFVGARLFGGGNPGFGETLSGMVVSYGVWAMTMFALQSLTFELTQEAQMGTLEQLSMSPFGLVSVLVARVFTNIVVYFGMYVCLLVVMMATTGKWLNLNPISTLPVLLVTLVGIVGVGFVLAGLAIVFKRVQNALQIYQALLIGLIIAPIDRVPALKYIPLAWGSDLLRDAMVRDVSIFDRPIGDLVFLAVNSVFYFFAGIAVFKLFERAARERGLLGHY
jgi:ABC-2 type transport system permease protein